MLDPAILGRAAAALLADGRTRERLGRVLVALVSPLLVLAALLCALASGTAEHNTAAVEGSFSGTALSVQFPAEYRGEVEAMQRAFALLEEEIAAAEAQMEDGDRLDAIRVKSVFYALYFGTDGCEDCRAFVDCFVTREEREDDDGEPYTAAAPVDDLNTVYQNISAALGIQATAEQRGNAEAVYRLIRYGYPGDGNAFAGADVPFIGADGFCSPIGEYWRDAVSSEFGQRADPFNQESRGHGGMDLAVPAGTPIRAALPGTVTVSSYNAGGYGYYVMIDHGGGLVTLYGHCSRLLARVGQAVEAGDVVALSGSTGRSTGPHLHFEVRVSGERTDPRGYLP